MFLLVGVYWGLSWGFSVFRVLGFRVWGLGISAFIFLVM